MSRRPLTILCIDDDWNGLMNRKLLLEQSGYHVIESSDSVEGLRIFCKQWVDAVILDYQLPGIGGDGLAARMKSLRPETPILLISSYGPLPPKKLRSVDMFLSKSMERGMLLSSLRRLFSKPKPFFDRWLDAWRGRNRTVPS